jgi:hypothetical protein
MRSNRVIPFPGNPRPIVRSGNPALVLVLPVVRFERHEPDDDDEVTVKGSGVSVRMSRGTRRKLQELTPRVKDAADRAINDLARAILHDVIIPRGDPEGA